MKKFIFTIVAFLFVSFINTTQSFASDINNDDTNENKSTQENISKTKDNNQIKKQKSAEDLFGDEQTFPFVAGLGKNAAH
tara:strand:+ start:82 stop:321 length:240 start_codon:yes stop_codon:yes gene_type:complete